eukprot:30551-Pelagococcus_subviridis.AAC.8
MPLLTGCSTSYTICIFRITTRLIVLCATYTNVTKNMYPAAAFSAPKSARRRKKAMTNPTDATMAARTLIVTTAPVIPPRPRQQSNRCMLDATVPKMPLTMPMKSRNGKFMIMSTENAKYAAMSVLCAFQASTASGTSGMDSIAALDIRCA